MNKAKVFVACVCATASDNFEALAVYDWQEIFGSAVAVIVS